MIARFSISPNSARLSRIQIIDFKTGLSVPADAAGVSAYHVKQMAAYAAALRRIFPGRTIEAALLFTEVARLIVLPGRLGGAPPKPTELFAPQRAFPETALFTDEDLTAGGEGF